MPTKIKEKPEVKEEDKMEQLKELHDRQKVADQVNQIQSKILGTAKDMVLNAAKAGKIMKILYVTLYRDEFQKWINDYKVNISYKTAQRYIKLSEEIKPDELTEDTTLTEAYRMFGVLKPGKKSEKKAKAKSERDELKQQMAEAIKAENFEEAAKLKKQEEKMVIENLKEEVIDLNETFKKMESGKAYARLKHDVELLIDQKVSFKLEDLPEEVEPNSKLDIMIGRVAVMVASQAHADVACVIALKCLIKRIKEANTVEKPEAGSPTKIATP